MTEYPRKRMVPGPVNVSVRTFSGNVRISGSDGNEVEVDLRPSNGNDSKAEKVIERSRVEITDRAVDIDVPKPAASLFSERSPAVEVHVFVPADSTAQVEAGSADVVIEQNLKDVEVQTGSGDVFAGDCSAARAKTGSGDIRLHRLSSAAAATGSGAISVAECDGEIDVHSASGDVEIDHVATEARAQTASGDIQVASANAELTAKTASGAIGVRRVTAGEVSVTTVSGGITVAVADGTAAKLDCSSVTGRLTSELDGIEAPDDTDRTAAVSARSVSGGIDIVRA